MKSSPGDGRRPQRADARDNRERLLQAARAVFTEQGPHASLNKIAQRAGVGPGTLYRHFPNLQALLVAIIGGDVEALCSQGRELLEHPSPDEALRIWLRAIARHATAMRGLVATQMIAQPTPETSTALAACHHMIHATGTALLGRAQHHGNSPAQLDIADLLMLANAIAWASEQTPADTGLLDRLLALINIGVPHPPPS
ncbi:TetR/AcrR family transcriptional regulator [Streptosporangium sp. NBC_01639]|uniref:TetR/AcrR family transcriptional regulator n=1 Tax=Streptosporangium sp. NBC_01639 TaxID=2975948 RepID=UPI0038679D36|nr:TetR/AcrR family transcriptional regulator [Streptosporangium sp. NBC_01639]